MKCKMYKKYSLGQITADLFQRHLTACPECRAADEADSDLLARAADLRTTVAAPGLWQRIETDLRSVPRGGTGRKPIRLPLLKAPLLRAAAVLLVGILLGWAILTFPPDKNSGLLGDRALARVEEKETAYVQAIAALEQKTAGSLADLNLEMVFLYKARLQAIDDQILRCRETLAKNPANNHVRRYLLAALQDKKETLREILSVNQGRTASPEQTDI